MILEDLLKSLSKRGEQFPTDSLWLIATGSHGERGTAPIHSIEFMDGRVLFVTNETMEVKRSAVPPPEPKK